MILIITSLVLRKPLLVCNRVLLKIYFTVSRSSIIVTQLLNIAKKRDFEEAQNHNELEKACLLVSLFWGFQCYFSYGLRERFSLEFINNYYSLHLAPELAHYLLLEAHSFPRATLLENCSLFGTDNIRGQISEHVFVPNGGCVNYPSNIVRHARSFEN